MCRLLCCYPLCLARKSCLFRCVFMAILRGVPSPLAASLMVALSCHFTTVLYCSTVTDWVVTTIGCLFLLFAGTPIGLPTDSPTVPRWCLFLPCFRPSLICASVPESFLPLTLYEELHKIYRPSFFLTAHQTFMPSCFTTAHRAY